MGGNATVIEGNEVTAAAEPIDVARFGTLYVRSVISKLLFEFNDLYVEKYGERLFVSPDFVGSTALLFDSDIPGTLFAVTKPKLGDIDVRVDHRFRQPLTELLQPGLRVGDSVYLGRSETSLNQLNCIFYTAVGNIQLDFWFAPEDEWSLFSHSSPWEDTRRGIKGVFHKYLLGSVDFAFPMGEITVLTRKQFKPKKVLAHKYALSVDRGLREKYEPACEGAYFEIKPEDAVYDRDLSSVFEKLFRTPPIDRDLDDFRSFSGIFRLMQRYLTAVQIDLIKSEFFNRCYGKNAQQLYRDDPAADMQAKVIALSCLEVEFLSSFVTSYYESYRTMEDRLKRK